MLYRELIEQAQVLSYADQLWLLALVFMTVLPILPQLRRVLAEENERARSAGPAPGAESRTPAADAPPVPDAID